MRETHNRQGRGAFPPAAVAKRWEQVDPWRDLAKHDPNGLLDLAAWRGSPPRAAGS